MSGLGGFLLALGLADLISGGMAGETENRLRSTVGAVAAGWIAAWTAWMLGLATANSWLYIGIVLATSACWISLRMLAERTPRIGILALLVLGMGILATVTLAGRWAGTLPLLDRWLAETPITVLQAWTSDRWLLFVGLLAFLTATSNAIVRSILRATGTEFDRSRRRLRGGRVIGVLERWLIFGLALAGEPTAAALIVSAKSLLRFPELASVARDSTPDLLDVDAAPLRDRIPIPAVDYLTEYFLMGSLISWTLALAPSLLFRP